jgi:hypothetical protein
MGDRTSYQVFLNTLAQLEQDQTLYEADLEQNEELKGIQHEEIIKLGGLLCKRLQKFAEKGETFADQLAPDLLPRLQDAMVSYQTLIVPPKIFGGFCPCLKPARSGPEYDKKLFLTKAKMVAASFLAQAVLIESKGEEHNMESVQYADYVSKMNIVFKQLDEVKYGNSEKSLEAARLKLLAATETVDRFVQLFGEYGGKKDFKMEALRRIRQIQEMLDIKTLVAENKPSRTPTNGKPSANNNNNNNAATPNGGSSTVSKRLLIKAQSSMQEIMNSAAAISSTQAKDNLKNLESLGKLLKKSRDLEIAQFQQLEEAMAEHNLLEDLARLRESCVMTYTEASVKVKDATKRWTVVKNQSVPRKVAEYDDSSTTSTSSSNLVEIPNFMKGPPINAPIQMQSFRKPFEDFGHLINEKVNTLKDAFIIDDMPTTAPPPPPKPHRSNNNNNQNTSDERTKTSNSNNNRTPLNKASTVIFTQNNGNDQRSQQMPNKSKSTSSNNMFNPFESLLGDDT